MTDGTFNPGSVTHPPIKNITSNSVDKDQQLIEVATVIYRAKVVI